MPEGHLAPGVEHADPALLALVPQGVCSTFDYGQPHHAL